jgi:hypothetical protein
MGRYLGLKKETTFGTAVVPDVLFRVLSEGIKFSPNQTYHRTIEGGRVMQTAQSAKEQSAGVVRFIPVYDKGLGDILYGVFGKVASVEDEVGVRWTHTFTHLPNITDVINFPSFTFEKGLDSITAERYSGCGIGKIKITGNPADFVTIDADVFGQKPTTETLIVSPTFPTQQYITMGDITTFTIGGASPKLEAWDIEITGGAIPVWYPANKSISNIDTDPFEAKMNMSIRFLTTADLTNFLNNVQPAMVIEWTGPALGGGNFKLKITMPQISWDEGDVVVNEQERLVQLSSATAIDDGNGEPVTVELTNDTSAY